MIYNFAVYLNSIESCNPSCKQFLFAESKLFFLWRQQVQLRTNFCVWKLPFPFTKKYPTSFLKISLALEEVLDNENLCRKNSSELIHIERQNKEFQWHHWDWFFWCSNPNNDFCYCWVISYYCWPSECSKQAKVSN